MNKLSDVRIRSIQHSDVPVILVMGRRFRLESGGSGGPNEEHFKLDAFANPPRLFAFIAEVLDQPAGYLSGQRFYDSTSAMDGFFVCDLFVEHQYRRRGVATALIEITAEKVVSIGGRF